MARRHSGVAVGGNRRRVSGVQAVVTPPLAWDASSVNFHGANHSGSSASQPSSTFTPPGGAVLVITAISFSNVSQADFTPPPSITDNLGTPLTYTAGPKYDATQSDGIGIGIFTWWAYVGATSPGAMAVTVTINLGGGQDLDWITVAVDVWDNALTTGPFGASANAFLTNTQDLTVDLTPTAKGSAMMLAAEDAINLGAVAAGTGCYLVANTGGASSGEVWAGTSSGPVLTTSLSPVALAMVMASTGSYPGYLAYEVLAA